VHRHTGVDVGGADLRADGSANARADSASALAMTEGDSVSFAKGQFDPNSAAGRELIGHELTHVAQQQVGRASEPQLQEDETSGPAKLDHLTRQTIATLFSAGGCNVAQAWRLWAIGRRPNRPVPTSEDEAMEIFLQDLDASFTELGTINVLGPAVIDEIEAGFPLTWAHQVALALKLEPGIAEKALADAVAARDAVFERAPALAALIAEEGLPVPYEEALGLGEFHIKPEHYKQVLGFGAEEGIRDFVEAVLIESRATWYMMFVAGWTGMADHVVDQITNCKLVILATDYDDFLSNQRVQLDNLQARLKDAIEKSQLLDIEKEALSLGDAHMLQRASASIVGLIGVFFGWADGSGIFDTEVMKVADGQIASLDPLERWARGTWWARHYLGDAVIQLLVSFVEHLDDILFWFLLIQGAQLVPFLNIAVDVALIGYLGYAAYHTFVEFMHAQAAAKNATSVVQLQRAAAQLALVDVGILPKVFLLVRGFKETIKGIGEKANKLQETSPRPLSREEAVREVINQVKHNLKDTRPIDLAHPFPRLPDEGAGGAGGAGGSARGGGGHEGRSSY
jgi:hypothetical protein